MMPVTVPNSPSSGDRVMSVSITGMNLPDFSTSSIATTCMASGIEVG